MIDLVFLGGASLIGLLGFSKYRALRHAPPEHKPAMRPVTWSCLFAALAVLLGAPSVGMALDQTVGVHSLSVLLGYCFALAFVCSIQVMLVYWQHPAGRAWRSSRWLMSIYGAIVALVVPLFVLGERPVEHLLDFPAVYAREPYLAELLVLHFLAYAGGQANVVYLCWRWSHHADTVDRPWLRRGLRITAVGMVFPVLYGVITLAAVAGSWFGAALDSWSTVVGPAIAILGVPIVAIGHSIASWGPQLVATWSRIAQLRTDLHDYRQLGALWRALQPVEPEMVHPPSSLLAYIKIRSRLFWRVIEINDWLHQLPVHHNPLIATAARDRASSAGLNDQETSALVEAAQLKAALLIRARDGSTEAATQLAKVDATDTGRAFAGERRRLVMIARAWMNPLSGEAAAAVNPAASTRTRSQG